MAPGGWLVGDGVGKRHLFWIRFIACHGRSSWAFIFPVAAVSGEADFRRLTRVVRAAGPSSGPSAGKWKKRDTCNEKVTWMLTNRSEVRRFSGSYLRLLPVPGSLYALLSALIYPASFRSFSVRVILVV